MVRHNTTAGRFYEGEGLFMLVLGQLFQIFGRTVSEFQGYLDGPELGLQWFKTGSL